MVHKIVGKHWTLDRYLYQLKNDLQIGVREIGGRLEYLVQHKDNWPMKIVPSAEAFDRCPRQAFDFLQSQIRMEANTNPSSQSITESLTVGQPINVECKHFYC